MPARFSTFVDLSACTLLRRGQLREVYAHPDFGNVLIKVIRPDRVTETGETRPWKQKYLNIHRDYHLQIPFTYNGRRRWGLYSSFYRELRETLRAARSVFPATDTAFPFAPALGFVWTSGGLGLLVEKMLGPDGGMAPTVNEMVRAKTFTVEHRALLDRFFEETARSHVVFGDLNISNLVLTTGPKGSRIVCVDGVGEKALIPVHEWWDWANRRKLQRLRRRMMRLILRRMARGDAAEAHGPPPAAAVEDSGRR